MLSQDHYYFHHHRRLQASIGVVEITEDIVQVPKDRREIDNTFIIYTIDNDYQIGTFRLSAGKALPYIMDSNLPVIVRELGVPVGLTSNIASAHLDFAPTFLDIMGVPQEQWPPFLDRRSLLPGWHDPVPDISLPYGNAKEITHIEFGGDKVVEALHHVAYNNTHKMLRIVSEHTAWMFVKWFKNELELYNTTVNPWEINNLAKRNILV
ncbi:alkaline phosphatase-like protein [Thozetella sp. PMI_491]|nr:alkaline phosphatase-like protein [Thozetella sp. PMI_491]